MPGNNSTPWGESHSACCPRGNWAMEQCGSPTQGDLVTEGTDTRFSRPQFQIQALELFSGLPGQSFGPPGNQVTQIQSTLHPLIIQKEMWDLKSKLKNKVNQHCGGFWMQDKQNLRASVGFLLDNDLHGKRWTSVSPSLKWGNTELFSNRLLRECLMWAWLLQ